MICMRQEYSSNKRIWLGNIFTETFGVLALLYGINQNGINGLKAWPMIVVPITMILSFAVTIIISRFFKIKDNVASVLCWFPCLIMTISLNVKPFTHFGWIELVVLVVFAVIFALGAIGISKLMSKN